MAMALVALCLILFACRGDRGDPLPGATVPIESSQPTEEERSKTPPEPPPITNPVLKRVCSSGCSGKLARVTVWRDANGDVGRYQYHGDINTCSSPPMYYFDAQGNMSQTVPLVPVAPGSPEAQRFQKMREGQLAGLTKAETIFCHRVE